jgi:hypothetical protein
LSSPFAGMTRIRFKGFLSARNGAPLGTMFNVCARAGVSMRAAVGIPAMNLTLSSPRKRVTQQAKELDARFRGHERRMREVCRTNLFRSSPRKRGPSADAVPAKTGCPLSRARTENGKGMAHNQVRSSPRRRGPSGHFAEEIGCMLAANRAMRLELRASYSLGSWVTATFTTPLASAITRSARASNSMPVRRTPVTAASTRTPSPTR